MKPRLEEVFKLSGVPTYTFVRPLEYPKLLVSLRTAGRGVVIEGPSGIGKTTAVDRALSDLGMEASAVRLSARKRDDVELISELPEMPAAGTVIIDDFHRLPAGSRKSLADFLKLIADEERTDVKMVVVGISRAGESLIQFGEDLHSRVDTISFESNPSERVAQVLDLGAEALNISFSIRDEIVTAAAGSFYLAQFLAHQTCLQADVLEACDETQEITVSYEVVRQRVMENLSTRFMPAAREFAKGTKLRREGRAPYLHVLRWLAEANEWSIQLDREMSMHPALRGSAGQIVEKGYLSDLLQSNDRLRQLFHFDAGNRVLAVEDPQFVFFIRNILWNKFAEQVGFVNQSFDSRYDFALSFAGADRAVAEKLFDLLQEREFEVFYDRNEAHRILAEDIEDYLGPVYRTEARFVVCLLGPEFPKRIWTRFESDQFRERFGKGAVIPVWFTTAEPGMFDESTRIGGFTLDPLRDLVAQLRDLAEMLTRKMGELSLDAESDPRDVEPGRSPINLEIEASSAERSPHLQAAGVPPADLFAETDLLPSEPVTVVLSAKGWVRSGKGHDLDPAELTYKSGDSFLDAARGRSNQPAIFLDSTGRSYSLAAHTLPSARGHGEPLTGSVSPPSGAGFVGVALGAEEDRVIVASDYGYGFVAKLGDMATRHTAGKALLTLPAGSRLLPPAPVPMANGAPEDDLLLAAATTAGYLLVFPLADLPELPRSKGNKIINIPKKRQGDEVVASVVPLGPRATLRVHAGKQYLNLGPSEFEPFHGNRAQRGGRLPRGFWKVERLEVVG